MNLCKVHTHTLIDYTIRVTLRLERALRMYATPSMVVVAAVRRQKQHTGTHFPVSTDLHASGAFQFRERMRPRTHFVCFIFSAARRYITQHNNFRSAVDLQRARRLGVRFSVKCKMLPKRYYIVRAAGGQQTPTDLCNACDSQWYFTSFGFLCRVFFFSLRAPNERAQYKLELVEHHFV